MPGVTSGGIAGDHDRLVQLLSGLGGRGGMVSPEGVGSGRMIEQMMTRARSAPRTL